MKKAKRKKELEDESVESMETESEETTIEGQESEETINGETDSEMTENYVKNYDDVLILKKASLEMDYHIALHKIAIFTALKVSKNF